MDTAQLIERLRAFAKAMGWNKWEYARRAGLRDTVLRRFNDTDWNPTVDTIRKLEALIPADWQAGDPAPLSAKDAA